MFLHSDTKQIVMLSAFCTFSVTGDPGAAYEMDRLFGDFIFSVHSSKTGSR